MQAYANIREPRPRNQPVTVQPPTAKDRNTTASLMAYLREMQLFEPEEESMRRETVLAALNELCVNWCKEVFLSKGYSEDLINEAAPKIFTFGSYRLGVHDPGADIDTLCVFSSQVDRKDFFTSLVAKLMTNPEITNITPVEAAKVPVISMEYLSVPIDLTCARLNLNVMPEDLLLADPKILGLACDSTDILSLNGPRVTDTILNLVPERETFRTALRTIKYWAKCRGIYSNALGFPGGVAWAMMTASVCQSFPTVLPSNLLLRLFYSFAAWPWPTPVLLTDIQYGGPLTRDVWVPDNRVHLMPVITPTYPAFNSTFNITVSTKKILQKEFERGKEKLQEIFKGTATWESLCEKLDFFQEYLVYLRIDCITKVEDDFRKLHGLVESRLRFMIKSLDNTEGLEYVHPKMGAVNFPEEGAFACAFFIGLKYKQGVTTINVSMARNEFKAKLTAQMPPDSDINVSVITKRQLPDWVFPGGKRPAPTKRRRVVAPKAEAKTEETKTEGTKTEETNTEETKTEGTKTEETNTEETKTEGTKEEAKASANEGVKGGEVKSNGNADDIQIIGSTEGRKAKAVEESSDNKRKLEDKEREENPRDQKKARG
eukprot:TRINITY_DN1075_c0_g1_i3.p1 TRINITY_DN1075_c0_g1~~TRINITY_DN1075_c0_g1_i3.p1  ORF type:complete len:602 (+),score=119.48 TRINITY_DN1075_c0_g1_i3:49-1854(+)